MPRAHESTHLGDEYVIIAQRPTLQPPFERINVSYEYQEYGVSLDGNDLFSTDDEWTVRHGGNIPWGAEDPSPEARAIMAVMALHAKGGTNERRAGRAVEAYLIHRGW